MDNIKKNLVSIIFGVIALLALVAVFLYPIPGMYDDLKLQLRKSTNTGTSIDTLRKGGRFMPQLSPDPAREPLNVYPTSQVIEAGVAAIQEIHKQSDLMMGAALDANKLGHSLLLPLSLPNPDATTKYNFADQYSREITDFSRWQKKLNFGTKPTDAEIKTAKDELREKVHGHYLSTGSSTDEETEYTQRAAVVKQRMDYDRASKYTVYLQPDALTLDTSIGIGGAPKVIPNPAQIWDAQLSLWIIDDVTTAIARANDLYSDPATPGGPPVKDILHAPIKQIEKIQTPPFYVRAANAGETAAGVTSDVPIDSVVSATGHVSNALFDVYHFTVILDVDATKIPIILRELQVNQFITVLNFQLSTVDSSIAAAGGFIYGDKPVAHLEIQMEELLLHDWTNDWIPESRKGGPTAGQEPGMPGMSPDMRPNGIPPGMPGYVPR